ncbi:MAG: hypothetical protein ACOCYT_05635 [Chloroflexota bacterium]
MASPARSKSSKLAFPWLWPVLLVTAGVVLLLDNFLLLEGFNAVALLPLLLIVAGAQVLLRGDIIPTSESRTFGITRGSVESATLEISSGGIDVAVRPLQREGRLIAGQFAPGARPALNVQDTYAHIRMDRAATPWFALTDWAAALATDLPWQVLVSTHLGQIDLDLSDVIIHEAIIASGVGDIRLVCPPEAFKPVYVRSALGNIHIVAPPGHRVRVQVNGSRFFRARHDEYRYDMTAPGIFDAKDADPDAPQVVIQVSGTFGDAYLV